MLRWATVVALSMTPALLAGQSAACAAGIGFGFDWRALLPVIAASGFAQGLLVMWLADQGARLPRVARLIQRLHKPRAVDFAQKWGPWGGLTLGVAVVGQEPILIALRWLGVETRRIWLPLAISNALFAALYYLIVAFGWDQASRTSWDTLLGP